ncbi:cupin domain-containing protein [Kiloniella laminariae]|uniref:cupin domain-containing protein n=1 Tax=Kiloniella laminariae TaxID=454162 RepID=UPI000366AAB5|nr:cupin domain-containing protein [Kiloniella laminariae]
MLEDDDFDLGLRLRALRQMNGLSQRELAKRAGVSNAVISLIEQNKSSPSIGVLKKVLAGIPISVSAFFSEELTPREKVFYRAEEMVEIGSGNISYRQIGRDLSNKALQILLEKLKPGADTGETLLRHESEEAGIVVRGEIELTVGDQRKILREGDGFYFDSRIPHRWRNPGTVEAVIVSACTPPTF